MESFGRRIFADMICVVGVLFTIFWGFGYCFWGCYFFRIDYYRLMRRQLLFLSISKLKKYYFLRFLLLDRFFLAKLFICDIIRL